MAAATAAAADDDAAGGPPPPPAKIGNVGAGGVAATGAAPAGQWLCVTSAASEREIA